ncbi:MAG TPA: PAAR domain-containing protein [Syntrophorhabdales bacterium]|nr:PAAR domain-containing protein [Syntrophorhabdales bacterium]
MGEPAARVGDDHKCPVHGGGPIIPPCHAPTLANGRPMARVTDQALCPPTKDFIVTGSATVQIGGKAAARVSDKTMHGGVVVQGSGNVIIGGSATGSTLGNPSAGLTAFNAAAKGRFSESTQQSAQNCGIESARQIINQATGKAVREKPLLNHAIRNKWAEPGATWRDSGGTDPAERQAILKSEGVDSVRQPQNMENIQQAVAEGRGVITSHDAGLLWGDPTYAGSGHAVTVTGIEYDKNGNPDTVFINDTGTGNGAQPVPAAQFESSLRAKREINVTKDPIW